LAGPLGIAIPNRNRSVFSGTTDSPQIAYFENVRARIWDSTTKSFVFDFGLYAGFCDTLEHVGHGLLGQNGFFSRFVVKFDGAENLFDIELK